MTRRKFLTTTGVAAELRLSRDRARQLCEEGAFPNAMRAGPGGHWRVPREDVSTLIARSRPIVRRRVT
jgi:excisionase family DNA binding protein